MPKCTNKKHSFGRIGRREIEANFAGGAISTDGGAMLLSRIDHFVGISRAVAGALVERRDSSRVTHCLEAMVRQRLFALAQGHEDLNDHDKLRSDPLFQTAIGTVEELASSPTLCRLERQVTRKEILALNAALVTQFIKSHDDAPKCLILDFDASDIPLHGNQEGRQFHGYYDHHCYLPLYVYCGDEILASVLRPRVRQLRPQLIVI